MTKLKDTKFLIFLFSLTVSVYQILFCPLLISQVTTSTDSKISGNKVITSPTRQISSKTRTTKNNFENNSGNNSETDSLISKGDNMKNILLSSNDFNNEELIPIKFTCQGSNSSPSLKWSEVPQETKSFALIVEDPDAPQATPFIHWVIFNIPANKISLSEAMPKERSLTGGARQGTNSFNKIGYDGPCPPKGSPHRYYFKIFALDKLLDLKPGASKDQLEEAMQNHIIGSGQIMGLYQLK